MIVPKVSCVLPIVEAEESDSSIESIKNQDYDNLEIIVAKCDTLGESLNQGIKNAKGKYIAIILPGDEWLSEKIKTQINYLENEPEILISCAFKSLESVNMAEFPQTKEELLVYLHTGENPFSDSSLVFKRELLDKIGGFKYALSSMCIFDFLLRGLTVSDILIVDTPLVHLGEKPQSDAETTRTEHEYNLTIYKSIKDMSSNTFLDCFGPYLRGVAKGITPNTPCEKAIILSDLDNPFKLREFTDLFEKPENKAYFEDVCGYLLTDFYKTNLNPVLFDKSYYSLCIKLNEIIESLNKGRSHK